MGTRLENKRCLLAGFDKLGEVARKSIQQWNAQFVVNSWRFVDEYNRIYTGNYVSDI